MIRRHQRCNNVRCTLFAIIFCQSLNRLQCGLSAIAELLVKTILPRCMECRRGLAMRILSVCLSVCLSVERVNCNKTIERSVQIFIPYERSFSLGFWEEEWLVGGNPFYLKFWVNWPPLKPNRRFWTDNRS